MSVNPTHVGITAHASMEMQTSVVSVTVDGRARRVVYGTATVIVALVTTVAPARTSATPTCVDVLSTGKAPPATYVSLHKYRKTICVTVL